MKSERLTARHPKKDDPDKAWFREVGSVLVDDDVQEYLEKNKKRIGVVLNWIPGQYYTAYFEKREQSGEKSGW